MFTMWKEKEGKKADYKKRWNFLKKFLLAKQTADNEFEKW